MIQEHLPGHVKELSGQESERSLGALLTFEVTFERQYGLGDMMVALAIRRPGFYFWLCHWPDEWLKTNDFHTSAKFQRASVRLTLSHFPPSCPFTVPASHTFVAQSWPLLCLMILYTSLATTSWHASLLCLGSRTPKQKGRFNPPSYFYQKHYFNSLFMN